MAWAGVINGKILPIVWFQQGETINSKRYLNLLKTELWSEIESDLDLTTYWIQQDGAAPHCSTECLAFLSEKFPGRIISRRMEHFWPAHSPDLSPLDFWLCIFSRQFMRVNLRVWKSSRLLWMKQQERSVKTR